MHTHPTPYPEVNAVLKALTRELQTLLADRLMGIYLYGSLATGDFDPGRSDIDFLVVTRGELPDSLIDGLEAMHVRLIADGPALIGKLEGSYLPQEDLRRYKASGGPYPCINEGRFYLAHHGSDWIIQRHTLRERAVVVTGPNPRAMIDPVQPQDLRRAVLGFMASWWRPMLAEPDPRLSGGDYQSYAVLTMCRALYTLERGDVASKSRAAAWAQEVLSSRWSDLIEWAVEWRPGRQTGSKEDVLSFIRYALNRSEIGLTQCPRLWYYR